MINQIDIYHFSHRDECRPDHPCELHGKNYTWCNLKEGGWDYCGVTKAEEILHLTSTYGTACVDKCEMHGSGYFWCHTPYGWDYCSQAQDTTTYSHPCNEDHPV